MRLSGKRPRPERLDRQPGRSCAVPFLPGGWHSRLCGKKDGTIITSYFDEGVFGNYGWDEPLGACGLIAWTSEGTPLWKNENYSIYDCYAISLDEEETCGFIITMNSGWCGRTSKRTLYLNCQSKEAELFLLPRPAIPSCFKADTSNGINSTSLPLMVITLGKTGGYSHL